MTIRQITRSLLLASLFFAGCGTESPADDPLEISPTGSTPDGPAADPQAPVDRRAADLRIQDLPIDVFVRAQLALSSCGIEDELNRAVLARLHPPVNSSVRYVDAVYVCLSEVSNGCDDVDACLAASNRELTAEERAECQSGCDGTVMRRCWSNAAGALHTVHEMDCAAIGKVCDEGGCVEPKVVVGHCEPGDKPACVDGWITECQRSERVRIFDCGAQHQRCLYDEEIEWPYCEGEGPACTFDDRPRGEHTVMHCNDGTATQCGRAQQFEFACADLHPALSCQVTPWGESACALGEEDCRAQPRCAGDVLTTCVAGKTMHLDCGAMGFAGCLDCSDDRYAEYCPARCARDAEDLANGIDRGI